MFLVALRRTTGKTGGKIDFFFSGLNRTAVESAGDMDQTGLWRKIVVKWIAWCFCGVVLLLSWWCFCGVF